jgi:hypothetical protein
MNRKEEIYLKGRCPCPECSGTRLDDKLVKWILDFEKKTGLKIEITSGARCKSYNQKVGGYWNSPHLTDSNGIGHAIDFQIKGMKPIEIAFKVDGLKRIGIYKYHVHGDLEKPNPSKYWHCNKECIYSRQINNLKDFLIQLKKEGRLSKDERITLDLIISSGSGIFSIQKKEGIYPNLRGL